MADRGGDGGVGDRHLCPAGRRQSKEGVTMKIDTNTIVSVTEANQNFSRVARIVDRNGEVVIFKNNKPKYLMIDLEQENLLYDLTDEEKLENLIKAINDLKATVGIKNTIKDYGVDEKVFLDNLDEMVEQAFDDQCTGANPRYPLMSEIKEMYLNAYYGKHFTEKAMPTAADVATGMTANAVKTPYTKGKKA